MAVGGAALRPLVGAGRLGCPIHAADLDTWEPYRTPKPLDRRQLSSGECGVYSVKYYNPEDPDYAPPEEAPRRKVLALNR